MESSGSSRIEGCRTYIAAGEAAVDGAFSERRVVKRDRGQVRICKVSRTIPSSELLSEIDRGGIPSPRHCEPEKLGGLGFARLHYGRGFPGVCRPPTLGEGRGLASSPWMKLRLYRHHSIKLMLAWESAAAARASSTRTTLPIPLVEFLPHPLPGN